MDKAPKVTHWIMYASNAFESDDMHSLASINASTSTHVVEAVDHNAKALAFIHEANSTLATCNYAFANSAAETIYSPFGGVYFSDFLPLDNN